MLLFLFIFSFVVVTNVAADDEKKPTEQRIREGGYPVEKHWTRTDDGYWLRMHRIPHGKNENSINKTKEVFFVQHGLTATSENFVIHHTCLAFTLADAGYDVWLGNTRGNPYSRVHDFYGNESKEYWDFSFDEMAKYDLPAMINYALANTTQERLWYVGHSQGTMIMFAKLSDDPDFQDKLKGFFAMAPIAKLDTIYPTIKKASRVFYGLEWLLDKTNIRRLPLPYHALKKVMAALCKLDQRFCDKLYSEIQRLDSTNIDWRKLPQFLAALFTDGDAAVKNLYHYCQLMEAGRFQKYDYGLLGNLLWYWSTKPPEYDLSNISTDTWLFSGTKDILASREDVAWIVKELGPSVRKSTVILKFNHLDFLWGTHAKEAIYDRIIEFARESNSTSSRGKQIAAKD